LSQGKFSGAWLRMDPMLAALRTPRFERLVSGQWRGKVQSDHSAVAVERA